jgi:hypothetical protein
MKVHFLAICGCLALAGCGPAATDEYVATAVFGSPENLNAVKTATKVTACRIKEPPEGAKDPSASWEEALALYKEGERVEISASQIEQCCEVFQVID